MKLINKVSNAIIVVSLLVLSGCASVNKASKELDMAAKKFTANPDYSQVYVYRNETFGAAISMPVTVNGKMAGATGPNSFFKFNLPAGSHKLTSQVDESVLDLTTENGEIYYVWQEVKMGAFSAGSKLQSVDKKKGQKGVSECVLIKSDL